MKKCPLFLRFKVGYPCNIRCERESKSPVQLYVVVIKNILLSTRTPLTESVYNIISFFFGGGGRTNLFYRGVGRRNCKNNFCTPPVYQVWKSIRKKIAAEIYPKVKVKAQKHYSMHPLPQNQMVGPLKILEQ